jgi:hypothetical protein
MIIICFSITMDSQLSLDDKRIYVTNSFFSVGI